MFKNLVLVAGLLAGGGLMAQTVQPSVVNLKKQAELAAANPLRLQAETIPDFSGKKEKPITILELPAGTKIAPEGLFSPMGAPAAKPATQQPAQQSKSNFLGVADEPYLNLQNSQFVRTIPPDVGGVAGADHLMAGSNNQLRIVDKNGVQVSKLDAQVFWQGVPGYAEAGGPYGAGDPHVLFDHTANRWITVAQTNLSNTSSLLVGVSQTADPTGAWNRYMFRTDATGVNAFDYPQIGFNSNWIVITGNMFPVAGGSAVNHQIYIFDKAAMYSGSAITMGTNAQMLTNSVASQGGWGAPVTPLDNNVAANTMYMLQPFFTVNSTGAMRLSTITGTLPNVTWNSGSAIGILSNLGGFAWSPFGNPFVQKDESRTLAGNDGRFAQAVMVNGRIWAAHHVLPAGSTNLAVQWWQINTNGTIVQNGRITDPTGRIQRGFPSIAVNAAEDAVIGYSMFSTSIFPSAAYSVRRACTPLNTTAYESIYKAGEAVYYKDFGSRPRWGDYSYTSLDPTTGRFWTIQQYAAARANGSGDNVSRWGTWWAEVEPQAANAVNFSRPLSIVVEGEVNGGNADCRNYSDVTVPLAFTCASTSAGTVNISVIGGTANNGSDFQVLTPTVNVTNGATGVNATVRIFNDNSVEAEETIILQLAASGNGVLSGTETPTHTLYIRDTDTPPFASGSVGNTIGTGTTTSGFAQPFRGSRFAAKTQMIYTAAELTAKGITAGNITKLGWTVTTKGTNQPLQNITIRMKHTSFAALNNIAFESGTTEVYSTPSYSTVVGLNEFALQTPFLWNGTDNILIEFCFVNPSATSGADDQTLASPTTESMTAWTSMQSVVADCNSISGTIFLSFGSLGNQRPDLRITGNSLGTPIANTVATSSSIYLGPFADQYVYSGSGEIIARIRNLSAHDYGCTQVQVDRAGTTAKAFFNNTASNFVTDKTILVTPANNNANGLYDITLYYRKNEVDGWQSATGRSWSTVHVAKTNNGVPTYTPGSVPFDQTIVNVNPTRVDFGENQAVTAQFATGFSGFAVGVPDQSLPVSWLQVAGRMQGGNGIIVWSTASERNNARFEVEVSRNGVDFAPLGKVAGKGNSNARNDYQHVHVRPQAGVNYYRIRQVDADGRSSYSQIITLQVDEKGQGKATIYPVPAQFGMMLNLGRLVTGTLQWEIFTTDMRLLKRGSTTGNQVQQYINVAQLPAGTYLLRINTTEGTETLRFVKQ